MSTIVVTGATGFVGRRVIEHLDGRGDRVVAITRNSSRPPAGSGVRWVTADLRRPPAYAHALEGADLVLHLAAATGKVSRSVYREANVEGTRGLIAAAAQAGVGRFVLVSSIAARFEDRRFYPYADTKLIAEELVLGSGLPCVIVRPTMVFGPGSPVQAGLERLARLPVVPVFGDGRTRVQPVDVADVVRLLIDPALAGARPGAILEIGGPRVYTMDALLAELRVLQGVTTPARFVHVPVGPLRLALAAVERPLLPLLPFTAGQLASFVNDGVAAPHPLVDGLQNRRACPSRASTAAA